jgi:hypothetical protein
MNYIFLVCYVFQLPVACKACPCGHNFFSARRAVITAQAAEVRDEGVTKRRRTERVKRGKPNYYDALEYEKQTKKVIMFSKIEMPFQDLLNFDWLLNSTGAPKHDLQQCFKLWSTAVCQVVRRGLQAVLENIALQKLYHILNE